MNTSQKNTAKRGAIAGLILLFSFVSTYGAGIIDRQFGNNGIAETTFPNCVIVPEVLFHPDGKFTLVLSQCVDGFARFNADGSPDLSFGQDGVVVTTNPVNQIRSAKLLADGKMLVAGDAPSPDGNSPLDFYLARYNFDGSVDSGFGDSGYVYIDQSTYDLIKAIDVLDDGRIVAVGTHNDGGLTGAVLRFESNGTLDNSFASGGLFYYQLPTIGGGDFVNAFSDLALFPDGRIAVGSFTARNLPGPDYLYFLDLVMLDSDGSLNPDFGVNGSKRLTYGTDFGRGSATNPAYLEPSGNDLFVSAGTGSFVMNSTGGIVRSFPLPGGAISVMPNGRFVCTSGRFGLLNVYSENALVGIATNNVVGVERPLYDTKAYAMPSGKILVVSRNLAGDRVVLQQIVRITSNGTKSVDYDTDDKSDLAVQKQNNTLNVLQASGSELSMNVAQNSKIVPEYWEEFNRRFTNLVVGWVPGTLGASSPHFRKQRWTGTYYSVFDWGLAGDMPVGGDFNGDGLQDLTVFRPSDGYWYSNATQQFVKWGTNGDKPVPADYDYDGISDRAVYRPSTGTWWILKSSGGHVGLRFGIASDIPVTGDYDGDGFADLTVYRPSEGNWYQLLTTEGFRVIRFGIATDYPVSGDFDGDGRHDVAVYREGIWHLLQSTDGYRSVLWGQPGDRAVSIRYDQ